MNAESQLEQEEQREQSNCNSLLPPLSLVQRTYIESQIRNSFLYVLAPLREVFCLIINSMRLSIFLIAVVGSLAAIVQCAAAETKSPDFKKDVAPIFAK